MPNALDWDRLSPQQKIAEIDRNRARGLPLDTPDPALEPTPEERTQLERVATAHWKDEQRECRNVFVGIGCVAYWLSQSRKTGQTPGLGDLWVFAPEGWELAWWWETKSGSGDLTESQQRFAALCGSRKVLHGSGDRRAARQFVITLGLAYEVGGVLEPMRRCNDGGHGRALMRRGAP
jgi:hypothetical protein